MTDAQHCPADNETPTMAYVQPTPTITPQNNLISPTKRSDSFSIDSQWISHPLPSKNVTFWTSCTHCKTLYEYQDVFINRKLRCNHYKVPFMAIEMPAPNVDIRSSYSLPVNAHSRGSKGPKPDKKKHSDGQNSTNTRKGIQVKTLRGPGSVRALGNMNGNPVDNQEVSSRRGNPKRVKELSRAEVRSMLMERARTEIILQLNKWNTAGSSPLQLDKT